MVNSQKNKKAIVLLSGGLDSTTLLVMVKSQGYDVFALSIDYGQRHRFELEAAERVVQAYHVREHKKIAIDLRLFGGSALTDDIDVPQNRNISEMTRCIPVTYVPARNTIFLSFALAWAEVVRATDIFIGINALDYSAYPDCRPEYIRAYQAMANLATKQAVEGQSVTIQTPLIDLTKGQIIRKGLDLGLDYSLTHSCYNPDETGHACGSCDSCLLRQKGFDEVGIKDPIKYSI